MKNKPATSPLAASLMRIGGVVVPIVIVVYLIFSQANFFIGRALLIAFGDSESTYKGASLEWDGDVVAKDFVLHPYDDMDEASAIRFEHVHLETPGWFWFLRNTFDRKLRNAKLERLHLSLSGGTSNAGIDPSLGDLGPIGASSASPFEAEGCLQDSLWTREELTAMGLSPEPTTLEFDFRTEAGQLHTTVVLETKGVSRAQVDRRAILPGKDNMLFLDTYHDETTTERWEIQDQGFVAARNRYCANKDKIEPLRFVDRHVASVARLLDTLGIGLDDEARTIYRRFARDGGKLDYSISYPRPLPADLLYELREHPGVIAQSNATIDHNGRNATIRWERFDPIPLPGLDQGEPTFAALQKEQAEKLRIDTMVPVATSNAASVPTPSGDGATPPAPPSPPAPLDVEALIASKSAAMAAAPASAPPAVAAPAATPAPTTIAPAGDAGAEAVVIEPTPETTTRRRDQTLPWDRLPALSGQTIRIWTVHNPPRTVQIVSGDGNSLRVRARLGGGSAEYTIQRDAFLRANRLR